MKIDKPLEVGSITKAVGDPKERVTDFLVTYIKTLNNSQCAAHPGVDAKTHVPLVGITINETDVHVFSTGEVDAMCDMLMDLVEHLDRAARKSERLAATTRAPATNTIQ